LDWGFLRLRGGTVNSLVLGVMIVTSVDDLLRSNDGAFGEILVLED
jgi:hypothetical protein